MAKPIAKLVKLLTPKRRWAQFSLATMFVVVTVLCVLLAVVVNRANRQRDAVAAVEALGCYVGYDANEQDGHFLRRWLPKDYTDEVVSVALQESPTVFGDNDLIHLRPLLRLQMLRLNDQITNHGLRQLTDLHDMKILYLDGTPITDVGLAQLRKFTDLERLFLSGTNVTDAGVAELQMALPKCKIARRAAYAQ